ncbi:hypothetical protein E4T39_04167 [Aureobasidium subglaciale]|nr:hypothetical protein E4T39_04167 [Aureobasidium subglaciale]
MADLNINKDHDAAESGAPESSSEDLATVVDDLLAQLSTKFANISSDLLSKSEDTCRIASLLSKELMSFTVDEMSRRLDNLETSIQASARSQNEEAK